MAVSDSNVGFDNAEATFDEVLAAELINSLPQSSAALKNLTVIPMGTYTERIPVLSALPTAQFLTADQEIKPKSATAWKNVMLQAEEIAVIVPISENVIADSSIDVVSRTTSLIVQEFGRVLDAAVFFGTGAPSSYPAGGIFGAAQAQGTVVSGTGAIADDLNEMFGTVEELGHDVSDVFADRALRTQLRGQKDGNGAPIYIPTEGDPNVGYIYGVPTAYPLGWEKDKATAIALDDSCAILGLRSDVKTKILTEANITGFGSLAERDSIAIRATMRVAFCLADPVSILNDTPMLPISALAPVTP
jgi:HK97 family phage major capsid protein